MRVLLVAVLALCGCAPEHQVLGRAYDFKTPKGVADDVALPLVVLAHGYGVNGVGQDFIFPFSGIVDAEQFRYAMPHGTQDAQGRRFWNANESCCNNGRVPVDDVAFFRALIDDVKARYATTRVFLVGHSNGGAMVTRLACAAPEVLDGVVAVSAATGESFDGCPEQKPLPMLFVHGTTDGTIPYEGKPGRFLSPRATAQRYGRRPGCAADTWEELERADFTGTDGTAETRRERLAGCTPQLELWSLEEVGHLPFFNSSWAPATVAWLRERAP